MKREAGEAEREGERAAEAAQWGAARGARAPSRCKLHETQVEAAESEA
jgi:hypothetical protein